MEQSTLILYIIKLALGGIAAFLAIMLWSKTRDAAWVSLVAGAVTSYAGIVYEMMTSLGIVAPGGVAVYGIPPATIFFTVIPAIFYITAFILMLLRT